MSCQSDFNTARTFSARNRLGLPHDLRMVDSPMNEVNKLSANLMKLAFMLGTNTEGSPISHLEETSLLENITRMNFLFDNVRGRQMQQLPIMDVARPIRSVQELAALAPIPALAQPPVAPVAPRNCSIYEPSLDGGRSRRRRRSRRRSRKSSKKR